MVRGFAANSRLTQMPPETIAIASDHAGVDLKSTLKEELASLGFEVLDLGTQDKESVDYPDMADALANAIEDHQASRGVAICGSGIGISMAANRHRHIRAALCHDTLSAKLAREHNDANVLALGARLIGTETARDCLRTFLNTPYEGGRHQRRVDKMS
jgi:ribose 5-phosphate isomerase B